MQAAQDITIGGRLSKTQYQYTLTDADLERTHALGGNLPRKTQDVDAITDVASDQANAGPLLDITVNRDVASTFGILPSTIDNTLDDAFGQRIVSTMLPLSISTTSCSRSSRSSNMDPEALKDIYVSSSSGQQVPLSTLVNSTIKPAPILINHQSMFPAVTISFNLKPGVGVGRRRGRDPEIEKRRKPAVAGDHRSRAMPRPFSRRCRARPCLSGPR